jgi:hypothetical protein
MRNPLRNVDDMKINKVDDDLDDNMRVNDRPVTPVLPEIPSDPGLDLSSILGSADVE